MEDNTCNISDSVEVALKCWSQGGLVAIPTETVYGLAAPVDQIQLIEKIFSYKERPFYDPLIVHVSSIEMAKNYGHWDGLSEKLAQKFWPGPLTLILPKKDNVSDLITSGLPTVGLRCPNNSLSLEVIRRLGVGVAAPSANKFTKTSPTTAEHVYESFPDKLLCILKGSEVAGAVGIESTIAEVKGETIKILRPGMITSAQIKQALGDSNIAIEYSKTAVEKNHEARKAPGQELVHYRPEYKLVLHKEEDGELSKEILNTYLVEKLNVSPAICAREVYLLLRRPLASSFKGKLLIIPSERLNLNEVQQEQWQSILNRLEKAGQWV